ncbi:MAG: hybrid sensor histidine kinase/response regulator [Rhodospirillaceae bacterium]|nr:hybrid sensor histidine kinase/response regulator [Rhodospirillaceae bacterium]
MPLGPSSPEPADAVGIAQDRTTELERENARLRKITGVLMDRVERSMDVQGSAFSLFQTSVTLGQVVRDRTMQLSTALNALAATNRELKTLNEQLQQENADRRAAEAAMLDAKNEAERANLSKTKLLAAISHDLLQPLNAARLFCAALMEGRISPRNRRLAGSLGRALEGVDGLLNALLEMSKLDAGIIRAENRPFSANVLLWDLVEEYSSVAQARGLDFRFVPCSAMLFSDQQLLSRIIRNFLSNAIRYTARGRVLLGCRRVGGVVRVGVWDTGPGIPEDKLDVIFEEFHQVSQPPPDREKGLGLGLAIVERIATILDHSIHVRSQVGRGTVFAVDVPRYAAPAVPTVPPPAAATVRPGTNLAGVRVLVIEDDPAIAAAMETLLGRWGCRVITATWAAQAIARTRAVSGAVDLVIADYHLAEGPVGLDSIETIQTLLPARVPAMLITADRSEALRHEARLRGYPMLAKPVKPAPLRAMITHLLSAKTHRDRRRAAGS